MDKNFGGVIWTDHALSKLRERGLKQGDAWATFRRPDQSRFAKARGAWIYSKTYPSTGASTELSRTSSGQARKIEVVAKKNEKKEWVILSVWSHPVFAKKEKNPSKDSLFKRLIRKLMKSS